MKAVPRAAPGSLQRRQGRLWAGLDAEFVESARLRLLQQRTFRVSQLTELATWRPDVTDAGRVELQGSLRAAARTALAEADAALDRIERGTYGRCTGCGRLLSMARLRAIPSAPFCGPCHRVWDDLGGQSQVRQLRASR